MAIDTNMPVLFVEDDRIQRRMISSVLRNAGLTNVDEADDGKTAVPMLAAKDYKLIISDWNMPEMSGYELIKHVRATEKTKAIPFIMMTAENRMENIKAAAEAGINGYIKKPFSPVTVKEKIEQVFKDKF